MTATMVPTMARRPRTRAQTFRHLAVDAKLWAPVTSPTIFRSLDWGRGEGRGVWVGVLLRDRCCASGGPLAGACPGQPPHAPLSPGAQAGQCPCALPSRGLSLLPHSTRAQPLQGSRGWSPLCPGPFAGLSLHQGPGVPGIRLHSPREPGSHVESLREFPVAPGTTGDPGHAHAPPRPRPDLDTHVHARRHEAPAPRATGASGGLRADTRFLGEPPRTHLPSRSRQTPRSPGSRGS